MEYRVEIQDFENLEEPLIEHYAGRDSIKLSYPGGDDKTKPIVPSELQYTLEVGDGEDAKYLQYFTANEKKWLVTKRLIATDEIIWRGFLLPETYGEPYEYPLFYVNFSATDGLGLLKGKKLTPDFYSEEKTITEVICACLKLTGIDFDVYLAPAIVNNLQNNWKDIILNMSKYYDEDELPSAFEILEEIISSMQCQLFQCGARWYVEGINKRQLVTVNFHIFSIDGEYKGTRDVVKNVKLASFINSAPNITMEPALRAVTVKHEAAKLEVSDQLHKETNIDWLNVTGVTGEFWPRYWTGYGYRARMVAPDYYLESSISGNNDASLKYISLLEKPYLMKGYKVRIKMAFELLKTKSSYLTTQVIADKVDAGIWRDLQHFQITLNGETLYNNENTNSESPERLEFDTNLKGEVTLEFSAPENGYLNIFLYQPVGAFSDLRIYKIRLTELSIENLNEKKNFVYTEIVAEGSSKEQNIELPISDDVSGNSKSFYLDKIKQYQEFTGGYRSYPVKYGYAQEGEYYTIVSLEAAVLIEQFKDLVTLNGYEDAVNVLEVVYNLNGGEEMAVLTDRLITAGELFVNFKRYKLPAVDRVEWLKWSDAIYKIEQKPYAQVVAEIRRKLFAIPHLKIEGTAEIPIKFNDILRFNFKGERKFFVCTDLTWSPDENESHITMVEGIYAGDSEGNIAPYVDAGPDIMVEPGEETVAITQAVATDPDGFVASVGWTRIDGPGGESFSDATILNPQILNFQDASATYQLEAIDNEGVVGVDTMRVIRVGNYTLILEEISIDVIDNRGRNKVTKIYKIVFSPELPENLNLILDFTLDFENYIYSQTADIYSEIKISKEGNELYSNRFAENGNYQEENIISIRKGQEVLITLESEVKVEDSERDQGRAISTFTVTAATAENSNVTNLPLSVEAVADVI